MIDKSYRPVDSVVCRVTGETALRERLKLAIKERDLPVDANAAALATVIYGMAVQAASAATNNELRRVIQTALRVWPE